MAKLYFRYGAMNSGKSTALMQVAHNYEEQGMQVLILKPQVDTKGGGELVSRLGVHRKADRLIRPVGKTTQKIKKAEGPFLPRLCGAEKVLLLCPLAGCELNCGGRREIRAR